MKKSYLILIAILIVAAAGAGIFWYLNKPESPVVSGTPAVSGQPEDSLGQPEQKPVSNGNSNTTTADEAYQAFSLVNKKLSESLKAVDSALKAGENGFLAMSYIYDSPDYAAFFSRNDALLKTEAEKSRAAAEESFLRARSAFMAAQSDATANTAVSVDKTLSFLNDISAALELSRGGLSKSVVAASITQIKLDSLRNSIGGATAGIIAEKEALAKLKIELTNAQKSPAYLYFLKNTTNYQITE